jgi:hypothetical protein
MKYPNDMHYCPVLKTMVFFGGEGGCCEIQEVRNDDMDAELLPFELDINKANDLCEVCGWYRDEE